LDSGIKKPREVGKNCNYVNKLSWLLVSIIRMMKSRGIRWGENVARIGEERRSWVDNIRMDLGEMGWDVVYWIGLAQDRNRWVGPVNAVMTIASLKMLRNYRVSSQLLSS
jgi:hypothetical protein